ncbi:MAG: molybdopterin molybdotransferase MoeA [Planctomycetota bacterium]
MIKFDDAFEIMMDSARRLGTERVDIEHALNRVLAEMIVSDIDMPPFHKSAMDGYACRRADLANELTVIETIPAGLPPNKAIAQNQCAKIMTGAVVPEGADCVIMVEYTKSVAENRIRFTGSSTANNICLKGEDIKKGDVVLRSGRRLAAQHIAVLASHGWVKPLVSLQPRVGIIATGNELVEPSQKPTACQIRNSNGFQSAAQVTSVGAIATNYGIAVDTEEDIEAKLTKAITENDVVILSGGVSVGDYDLVREILEKNKIKLMFEKVAVKPGKPMVFAVSDEVFCFGLPGNPVSTFVMFELLVKPFLFKMMGYDFRPAVTHKQLEKTIKRKKTDRDAWLPVIFTNDNKVASIEYHGSAHINALCEADGLLCIRSGAAEIKEGTTVAVRQI